MPASLWAMAKSGAGLAASPFTVPALTAAALRTAQLTTQRIEAFPDHLHAIVDGRRSPLPGSRTRRRPASERYLITSDLHRCVPGRLDWPGRQGTKELYAEVLGGYAADGWHLIENGDVEDFWMVGGSTWGALYDAGSLAALAAGPARTSMQRRVAREHLERIIDNNAAHLRGGARPVRRGRPLPPHGRQPRRRLRGPGARSAPRGAAAGRGGRRHDPAGDGIRRGDRRCCGDRRPRPPDRRLERSRVRSAGPIHHLARDQPGRPAGGAPDERYSRTTARCDGSSPDGPATG